MLARASGVLSSPHRGRALFLFIAVALLAGCARLFEPPGIAGPIAWDELPGWRDDRHAEAWPALRATCESRVARTPAWAPLCQAAQAVPKPGDDDARRFFETWFTPHRVIASRAQPAGLITGYYEPMLNGSRRPDERFRYPLYQRPADLLTIDLAAVYPELRGKVLRGRLEGTRVVPYFARADIDTDGTRLQGHELVWLDDPVARFFLQIQGSGRVMLPDGEQLAVGYADQNGHPYVALGKCLAQAKALPLEAITLQSIRAWLAEHPQDGARMMNCNPSYVFFKAQPIRPDAGPIGALNVSLSALRSIAVDTAYIPLGTPVWLDTQLAGTQAPFRRLVFAQDIGGAIRGPVRADLFCGQGPAAEALAGEMKQAGALFVLLPRLQFTASR